MPFIPFRPLDNQTSPPRAATVAKPAIVKENQAQLAATELLPVATVTLSHSKTVAVGSRTVATGNTDRIGTIATLATVAGSPPANAILRFFLDKAIPQGTAQGLAWLLDSLPHNPPAQRTQAEAALHWLAEEMLACRCAVLFPVSKP